MAGKAIKIILIPLFLGLSFKCFSQPKSDTLLIGILSSGPYPLLHDLIRHKDSFRIQIIYTQINRDENNAPSFRNYYFNVDTNLYFYPASTVKLPLAMLALEKLNELNRKGVDKYTPLLIDKNQDWQSAAFSDSTSESVLPSIAHYIKKIFLVSDNDAYNRLYQFVGQQSIHRKLREKGYTSVRIPRQFLGLSTDRNRYTNAVRFLDHEGNTIYYQEPAYNTDSIYFEKTVKIGKAYIDMQDSIVQEPFDFTKGNTIPLEDLQMMLRSVLFPNSVSDERKFYLTEDDRSFLLQYLSQFPSETNYPKYDTAEYYDSYVKFFFNDSTGQMPPNVRVFNKVGWAYGFLTDVAYVVDFEHKLEYMLSATVYANCDGVLNDDKYEYETIGKPFLYQLGQAVYHFEFKRPRKNVPDLSSLKLNYEKRMADERPTVKSVDN